MIFITANQIQLLNTHISISSTHTSFFSFISQFSTSLNNCSICHSVSNNNKKMTHSEETVVLFPFMAQGHLIPFLAFALQIEQKTGYKVIYVNTPLNIRKLKSSIPSNSSIQLVELPFCSSDHNLPPNSENTDVLPYPIIVHLLEASLSLKPAFDNLITNITKQQGHPPLCIIADMFFGWTVDIANELDIFHLIFCTGGAYGMAIYFSLWLNLPHLKTDSHEFTLPDFPEASKIHRSQLANNCKYATGIDPWSIVLQRLLSLWFKSDGILLNTVEEMDQVGLDYFRRKTGRPVWAIGPVGYSLTHKAREAKKPGINLDQCTKWLDTFPPHSVLYISFGSQNTISSLQMMELAIGLEASGRNFIWVIRPPISFDINGEFRSEWLPEGFEERVTKHNRGLLVHKWAPQLEILSHKSTRAFLSHCGWNSTLESLSNGVPIIGWPIAGDQFYNTKLLEEEVGVCVEIARGCDSEIKHEDVVRVIDLVMSETEKGEEMRKKAREVKEMIKDSVREDDGKGFKGSSAKAIEEFLSTALSLRKTKSDQNNEV